MNECTECHKYVGKCPYCHRPRPSIAGWKALKGVSAPIMSAENQHLVATLPLPTIIARAGMCAMSLAGLNTLLDAARSEGPQPPAVKVDEGVREGVTRIIAEECFGKHGKEMERLPEASEVVCYFAADQILALLGFCHNTTIS